MRKCKLLRIPVLYTLSFLVLAGSISAQTIDSDRFKQNSGSLPLIFSFDPKTDAEKAAAQQDLLEEKLATEMYLESNYQLNNLLHSGEVYVNDEFTAFLETMLAKMLPALPELKDQIRIIATRNPEPNAYCLPNGVIVVNVGLICLLENSSQLASVLAHEISHYKKQHALKKQKSGTEIIENENISSKAGLFRLLQFSREFEFEADAAGLTFLTRTPFDAREASKALLRLKSESKDTMTQTLSQIFNTDIFTVDTTFFSKKLMKSELKKSVRKNKSIITGNEESSETHPDVEKRALALNEILNSLNYVPVTAELEKEYQQIRHKAIFEVCVNSYNGSDYLNSLHQSLLILEKEPENILANEMLVKNLYWLCRLKENGVLEDYFGKVELNGITSLARLKLFLTKTKSADLGKMLYSFVKARNERFKDDQDMLFYLALTAEMHLGKDAAEIQYRNYTTKFPDGRYSGYVAHKLQ